MEDGEMKYIITAAIAGLLGFQLGVSVTAKVATEAGIKAVNEVGQHCQEAIKRLAKTTYQMPYIEGPGNVVRLNSGNSGECLVWPKDSETGSWVPCKDLQ